MAKEINVAINLDKSKAATVAAGFRRDMQSLNKQLLSDEEVSKRAEAEIVKKANKEKIAAAVAETMAVKDGAKQKAEAIEAAAASSREALAGVGKSGVSSLLSVGAAIPGLLMGLNKLVAAANAWNAAMAEAQERQEKRSKNVTDQLEPLAHIAALKGRQADTKFVVEQAELRNRTLMTKDESIAAQEGFLNSGEQFIGDKKGQLKREHADKAFELTAGLAVAKHIDPAAMADLTGRIVGMKDFGAMGDKAPGAIAAEVNKTVSILSAGGGDESHLAKEVAKVAAATVSEDAMRGTFKSASEVAKVVSVMNEVAPGQEAESARSMVKGLRAFDSKKSASLLKEAKIERSDDVFTMLKKLAPAVEARARKGPKGTTVNDVIRASFEDIQSQNAIAAAINKGVNGGMFEQRETVAQANATPEAVTRTVEDFRKSERGRMRETAARSDLSQTKLGSATSKMAILDEQVKKEIESTGKLDTTYAILAGNLYSISTLGLGDPTFNLQNRKVANTLRGRMSPTLRSKYKDVEIPYDPTQRASIVSRMIGDIEGEGGDPLSGTWKPANANAGQGQGAPAGARAGAPGGTDVLARLLEIQNKLLGNAIGPPGPPPPLLRPQPALRR